MCRLFGFRSIISSSVYSSLLQAENALACQSLKHPDGWGVAYFQAGIPHVLKSDKQAMEDRIFKRIAGLVSSQTVVAHIRAATAGVPNILNSHPFQFGEWVFAHNGNIRNFSQLRDDLIARIDPQLAHYIFGDTDSEVLFYFFLTAIKQAFGHLSFHDPCLEGGPLRRKNDPLELKFLGPVIRKRLTELESIVGKFHSEDTGPKDLTYLTFILSNASTMIGHQGGKKLYYSTYKKVCPEVKNCPHYSYECDHPSKTGKVNHLMFSSEILSQENVWIAMENNELIGVDHQMVLRKL